MCGINGLFSTGSALPGNTAELIGKMNQALKHRGPDDEGCFVDHHEGIALGHRRLSIIDLSVNGHQPMKDDRNNRLVYNGEIYNYAALKKTFPDQQFHTGSDSEVLMRLYAKYGHKALQELNGMFAFGFYNHEKKELQLARDRAGKRPMVSLLFLLKSVPCSRYHG